MSDEKSGEEDIDKQRHARIQKQKKTSREQAITLRISR
jgi:hypothetical protein